MQKYAGAGRAEVSLSERDSTLAFTVEDDGAGFDAATVRPGSGMSNMGDRIDALGGLLEVVSVPGQGTRVSATIPIGAHAA